MKMSRNVWLWLFGLCLTIPLAVILWSSHAAATWMLEWSPQQHLTPTRWLLSAVLPLIVAGWGLRRGSISKSGALVGFILGFFNLLCNYGFFAILMAFFVSGSKLTKLRHEKKRLIEADFRGASGNRNWIQVFCNGGLSLVLSVLYLIDVGVGETPLDFYRHYRGTWLSLAIIGSVACACGDTWASEVGSVVGGPPRLITNFRIVPRGTNGGISPGGLLCSLLGGLLVGITYYFGILLWVTKSELKVSGPQWPVILVGISAGLFGSLIDSILGATLQYSGRNKRTGHIVEQPGSDVVHISGIRLLDNHSVNFLATFSTGLLTPVFAKILWPNPFQ